MRLIIRPETPADVQAIRQVTTQAFKRPNEAKLIDALRDNGKVILSLVAVAEEQITGHLLCFPVVIAAGAESYAAVGLGPLAVLPAFQRQGIGSALARAGLAALKQQKQDAVIVLGHPDFYPRFGFVPASTHGLKSRYDVPDEVFMATELVPNGLAGKSGTVVYEKEFGEF